MEERYDIPESEQQPYLPESTPEPGWISRVLKGLWSELVGTVLPAIVIAIVIHLFLAQATRVYGQSMEPTLHTNDRIIIEKISYRLHPPRRGDIVVVRVDSRANPLIKRIVGLPGETIAIHDGKVFINGRALEEDYLPTPTAGYLPPTRIPLMHYFVLGDNRQASSDSRYFGPVSRDAILGRAFFRYWPPNKIGFVH